jgi:hypothetical protein
MVFIKGTPEAFPLNEIKISHNNVRPSKWKSQEKVKRHLNHIKMRLEKSMQLKNPKLLKVDSSKEAPIVEPSVAGITNSSN